MCVYFVLQAIAAISINILQLPVNKRLDEWVPEPRCDFTRLQPPKVVEVDAKHGNKRKAVDEPAAAAEVG